MALAPFASMVYGSRGRSSYRGCDWPAQRRRRADPAVAERCHPGPEPASPVCLPRVQANTTSRRLHSRSGSSGRSTPTARPMMAGRRSSTTAGGRTGRAGKRGCGADRWVGGVARGGRGGAHRVRRPPCKAKANRAGSGQSGMPTASRTQAELCRMPLKCACACRVNSAVLMSCTACRCLHVTCEMVVWHIDTSVVSDGQAAGQPTLGTCPSAGSIPACSIAVGYARYRHAGDAMQPGLEPSPQRLSVFIGSHVVSVHCTAGCPRCLPSIAAVWAAAPPPHHTTTPPLDKAHPHGLDSPGDVLPCPVLRLQPWACGTALHLYCRLLEHFKELYLRRQLAGFAQGQGHTHQGGSVTQGGSATPSALGHGGSVGGPSPLSSAQQSPQRHAGANGAGAAAAGGGMGMNGNPEGEQGCMCVRVCVFLCGGDQRGGRADVHRSGKMHCTRQFGPGLGRCCHNRA